MPSIELNHLLSAKSTFSLGQSSLKIDEAVNSAVKKGYGSVCLTDTMSVSSMIDFTKKSEKANIRPIIGCTLRVVNDPTHKARDGFDQGTFNIKVYVKNDQGMKDLYETLTKANSDDYFYYVPRIGIPDLLELVGKQNVVVSTGDFFSVFNRKDHLTILSELNSVANDSDVFIELVPINTPLFDRLNMDAIIAADWTGFPVVTTRPTLYESNEDADSLDVSAAVIGNIKMSSHALRRQYIKDFGIADKTNLVYEARKAKERMEKRYGEGVCLDYWKRGIVNIKSITDKLNYHWQPLDVCLPKLVEDEYSELARLCIAGWKKRLTKKVFGYMPSKEDMPVYKERLSYELGILKTMGFENYFLLVERLTTWSEENNIIVGPGRGSAAGSIIAFLLGITDIDPIRFGLIFERFINPDRLDLPDVDMDFMSSRRHEVIEHIVEVYGVENVAGISNYGTIGLASSLRDTARIYELNPLDYQCTKYMPKDAKTLDEAADLVPEIETFKNSFPEVWNHAKKLEGNIKSMGRHAAGVIIAGEPIVNRAVVERRKDGATTNWDKRTVEDQGLIKMDILGLATLDVLYIAKQKILQNHLKVIDYEDVPLDDEKVLKAFSKGDTVGIFQFTSSGMRGLLTDLAKFHTLTFDEIAATTALYRPGPMESGMMDDYVNIKQGNMEISYDHPKMEPALRETFGVMIYQESVMKLSQDIAGYSMAEADKLRKIMGKKQPEEMAKQRNKFVKGCVDTVGLSEFKATDLFDKIEKFAGYGFNKSHSVAYSVISYLAMWVKVNYPNEFYAASLSIAKEEQLSGIVKDAQKKGIFVVPPDVNRSTQEFEIGYDSKREQHILIAPFNRIKGISEKSATAMIEAREKHGMDFTSKEEFLSVVNKRLCNIRSQERLENVGSFAYPPMEYEMEARHPDRLKNQIEVLPGLIIENVKADRMLSSDEFAKSKLMHIYGEINECKNCDLAGKDHPMMRIGSKPKFMVITDTPNYTEAKGGKMMEGKASNYLRSAIRNAGLSTRDGYFTSLVKSPKLKGVKALSNEQINGCSDYIRREIEILNPPIIIACGANSVRSLMPGIKGSLTDLCGQVHYRSDIDASILFAINPQMIYIDPDKQNMLDDVFANVTTMI